MIGTPAFNPATPGAIGGTTPAAITGTTITANTEIVVADGNLNVRGATSTTTGITINAGVLRAIAGNTQLWFGNSTSLFITAATVANGGFFLNVSGVAMYANAGGAIYDYSTDGASVSVDGTEDTLKTDTLPAGALNANGAKLSGYYQVAVVGHAVSTDRIRLYFGGTAIFDSAAVNFPLSSQVTIRFDIIRVSSTVVRASVAVTTTTATVIPYSQYTEITGLTLSNTQIIKITDISTGANSAAGDVTVKLGAISWIPASDIDGP